MVRQATPHDKPQEGGVSMTETPAAPEPQQQLEPAAPEAQPEQQDTSQLPQWARDAITKANGEAAKYRTQVNELKPMADQFRQLDEASKSEAQRLQEALETSNRDRDSNAQDALRTRVALQHGLTADDLDLLGVGTEEQMTARATHLSGLRTQAAAAAAAPPSAPPAARTQQQLAPGATPSPLPQNEEQDAVYNALFGTPAQPQ